MNSPWFELLLSGEKQYEGRRLTQRMRELVERDIIRVQHHISHDQSFLMQIESIHIYPTFEHALLSLPLGKILPVKEMTISKGIDIYKQFVSIATQERDGVVMLELSLLRENA